MSRIQRTVIVIIFWIGGGTLAQPSSEISLRDRVRVATQIYHQVNTFYPELSQKQFDHDYAEYLAQILGASVDRRAFDLASMALVATLHDGHSWFYDDWLASNYGQPLGLAAHPIEGKWVVVNSALASLTVGDVIEAIDSTPTQRYFEQSRKYISASSERYAGSIFFRTPVVFPERFTLTVAGGRHVVIDRKRDVKQQPLLKTEGRWLIPGSVGYIKVPTLQGTETQLAALDYLKQFHSASWIILDVRGNPGRGDGALLQRALMDKPYPIWTERSAVHGGFLIRTNDVAYPEMSHVMTADAIVRPREQPAFSGRLILLIDRGCTCACEDFVMPYKITKRAQLVGETTAGTYSSTNHTHFENGMRLNIAAIRRAFPDGSRFEGVGIPPDVEVHPTAGDLKQGNDVVLQRALDLAAKQ